MIELNELNPTPKYLQIVEQMRRLVAEGALAPGAALPSVRQLAGDLGINVNTVLAAYHMLESEGVLLLRHGARAVVHPRLARAVAAQPADLDYVRDLLERARTEARLRGIPLPTLQRLAEELFRETPTEPVAQD